MTEHLLRLGLIINDAKSRLTPMQCTTYLGLRLDSRAMCAYLLDDRVAAIQDQPSLFRQGLQPVREHRLQPTQPAAAHGLLRAATSGKAQQAGQGYFGPEKPDGRSPRLPGQTVDSSPCTFPSSTSSTCPDTDPILFVPRRGDERGGPGRSFDCSFLGGGLVGAAGDQEVTQEMGPSSEMASEMVVTPPSSSVQALMQRASNFL
ncbi:UNVERIFIED_CONTAM: hypothetical protein FKN15_037966 [Acipenser sinensis]